MEHSVNALTLKILGNNESNGTDEQERVAWSKMLHQVADGLSDVDSYGDSIVNSSGNVVGEWLIRPSDYEEEPGDEVGSFL